MPPTDLDSLWTKVAEDVRAAVGDSTYDVWIAPIVPVAFDGRELLVRTAPGTASLVSERFGSVIRASAHTVLAAPVSVVVEGVSGRTPELTTRAGQDVPSAEPAARARFSFDQFVLGPANRFAHACALAVAENPGTAYNPLFVCGPPGVGKTHLLHSVADYLLRHEPSLRVRLTTAEAFVNEFVAAVRGSGDVEGFKRRYRANDVLLVDDVQFLMSKTRTEEEFFHTFNALRDAGAQVMLTSDQMPREMEKLPQRLRDRFESGLVAEIGAPDMATRLAVLRKRALASDIPHAADDALKVIAQRVTTNLRSLEAALIRVVAFASLTGRPIDEQIATEVMDKLAPAQPGSIARAITVEGVQEVTCSAFGITLEEMLSPSREARLAWPRQLAMFLAREHTDQSLPAIGEKFGGRGHTTVLHACRRAAQRLAADPDASAVVERLSTQIKTTRDDRRD